MSVVVWVMFVSPFRGVGWSATGRAEKAGAQALQGAGPWAGWRTHVRKLGGKAWPWPSLIRGLNERRPRKGHGRLRPALLSGGCTDREARRGSAAPIRACPRQEEGAERGGPARVSGLY